MCPRAERSVVNFMMLGLVDGKRGSESMNWGTHNVPTAQGHRARAGGWWLRVEEGRAPGITYWQRFRLLCNGLDDPDERTNHCPGV